MATIDANGDTHLSRRAQHRPQLQGNNYAMDNYGYDHYDQQQPRRPPPYDFYMSQPRSQSHQSVRVRPSLGMRCIHSLTGTAVTSPRPRSVDADTARRRRRQQQQRMSPPVYARGTGNTFYNRQPIDLVYHTNQQQPYPLYDYNIRRASSDDSLNEQPYGVLGHSDELPLQTRQ